MPDSPVSAPRGVGLAAVTPASPPVPGVRARPPRSPVRVRALAPRAQRAAGHSLTASGRHPELQAATWAAGGRAHLSPASAALARRALRKRPPASAPLRPAAASRLASL